MSCLVEINNSILDFQLETVQEITANAPSVLRFYQALKNWHGGGVLSEITIQRDTENLHLYALVAEDKNACQIHQTWQFADDRDIDPLLTINIVEGWPARILRSGNRVQEHLFKLRPEVGLIRVSVQFH